MRGSIIFVALLAAAAAPLFAQEGEAPFTVRESGEAFGSLQEAVDSIGGGEGTILIAPGRYRQCAVQSAGRVAYVAATPGSVTIEGSACEGKGALVLGGQSAAVEGLILRGIRVPDENGAGIRLEAGDLLVRETMFSDGENGILVANDHDGRIAIERSTFSGLGKCPEDGSCSHSIYNSGGGSLSVSRSRFERGRGGHYVKSRGPRLEVIDSSFDDSAGRATNYMIDISEGATGTVARNVFVQGADKENYSAFVMVAPEGQSNSSKGLRIVDNDASIAPGVDRSTAFVADESGDALVIENNRLGAGVRRFEAR